MPSNQSEQSGDISLLKENAQYYQAVCALELGNSDAENLFSKFIVEYPSSANTELAYYHIGHSWFEKGNYPGAITWFKKINEASLSQKQSAEYRFMLGYSYFVTKDYKNAEPVFAKLKDEKTDNQESAIYYYAYLNYLDADYTTALKEFERLKGSKLYAPSYPYYISALYFLDKRYDDVLAFSIPALQTIDEKYKTEMYRIIGATYFAKQNYTEAASYYRNFQQRDQGKTQNNQDNYQIGYTFYKLKDYPAAIAELEKLSNPDIFYQSAMMALGDAYIRTNNKQSARNAFFRASKLAFDKQMQEEGLYNYAKLSYDLDLYAVALDVINEFIRTYPRSWRIDEAKILLGEVLLSNKAYQKAIDVIEALPEKTPEARSLYQKVTYYRGLEFYNERAFENSISMFMRSIANSADPEIGARATYWLGEAMFEVRKYKESVEQFEKFLAMPAAKNTGEFNYANYALAYAAFQNENFNKAATYFTRFLRGNDKDVNTINDATLRLADSYFVLKNYALAMQQYNKIIAAHVKGEDYALFQRGMIQGLQNQNETKISTLQSLLSKFPNSSHADKAGFEIGYTYFVIGNLERAKNDLTALIAKYPKSVYVPKALATIGLVQRNENDDDNALITFKKVISEYPTSEEAKTALETIKNIYLEKNDAEGFIAYANTTKIANLSEEEQDNITFEVAKNRFLRGDFKGAYEGINGYFDKFPRPISEKYARFIRAESLVKLKRPLEAVPDYNVILNDWTSPYTERSLLSISRLYLDQKMYNDAIVFLKKLETADEYKSHYAFAVTNLIKAYSEMQMPADVLKYADIINRYEKSTEEDKQKARLYRGKAYLMTQDTTAAIKEFTDLAGAKTIIGAEAKYNLALTQFQNRNFKTSLKTAEELAKTAEELGNNYWGAKAFILMADNYIALKNTAQAEATLESIIQGYEGEDDILPTAKEKLQKLNTKK
jgi:TolA-binding protein